MSPTSAGRAALLLTAVLAAGCAGGSAVKSLETLSAPDGSQLFRDLCASCHGVDGRGDGPIAEHLKAMLPDLTRSTTSLLSIHRCIFLYQKPACFCKEACRSR